MYVSTLDKVDFFYFFKDLKRFGRMKYDKNMMFNAHFFYLLEVLYILVQNKSAVQQLA
jgi:hypothetical protein